MSGRYLGHVLLAASMLTGGCKADHVVAHVSWPPAGLLDAFVDGAAPDSLWIWSAGSDYFHWDGTAWTAIDRAEVLAPYGGWEFGGVVLDHGKRVFETEHGLHVLHANGRVDDLGFPVAAEPGTEILRVRIGRAHEGTVPLEILLSGGDQYLIRHALLRDGVFEEIEIPTALSDVFVTPGQVWSGDGDAYHRLGPSGWAPVSADLSAAQIGLAPLWAGRPGGRLWLVSQAVAFDLQPRTVEITEVGVDLGVTHHVVATPSSGHTAVRYHFYMLAPWGDDGFAFVGERFAPKGVTQVAMPFDGERFLEPFHLADLGATRDDLSSLPGQEAYQRLMDGSIVVRHRGFLITRVP